MLLNEEMRRVKAFFGWQVNRWNERADQSTFPSVNNSRLPENALILRGIQEQELIEEGRRAYAYRQAAIYAKIQQHCEMKWLGLSESLQNGEAAAVGGRFVECHEVQG